MFTVPLSFMIKCFSSLLLIFWLDRLFPDCWILENSFSLDISPSGDTVCDLKIFPSSLWLFFLSFLKINSFIKIGIFRNTTLIKKLSASPKKIICSVSFFLNFKQVHFIFWMDDVLISWLRTLCLSHEYFILCFLLKVL